MRTSNTAIRDILSKRQKRSRDSLNPVHGGEAPNLFSTGKEVYIETLIQKLEKLPAINPTRCELNNEEKYAIVEAISEREKASFNKHTLAALMTVWKIPGTHQLELAEENLRRSSLRQTDSSHLAKNYFVLSGRLSIFDRESVRISRETKVGRKISLVGEDDDDVVFGTQAKCDINREIEIDGAPLSMIQELCGWGPLFRKTEERKNICLTAQDAIVVEIRSPEMESMLINLGGMDQDKKAKILECFPVFSSLGKRVQSILPHIELKHYTRNQHIYRAGQAPEAVYLIIKGEVIFQMKVHNSNPRNRHNSVTLNVNETQRSLHAEPVFQTETMGANNYFGEEEIISKCDRKLSSICHSAECELLEIPLEKFEKLLAKSDFYEVVQNNAITKTLKREEKIGKAVQIYVRMRRQQEEGKSIQNTQRSATTGTDIARRSKLMDAPKVMHGNVIKRVRANHNPGEVNFSMLKANPDMYDATMKKFRKFTMKPMEKYKPDVNWDLKRVWKVLNLENVLREEAEISSPEGRKFYESHRRYQNHVNEVKSIRPKTSSSTYRTKLQYISYLQQFNN